MALRSTKVLLQAGLTLYGEQQERWFAFKNKRYYEWTEEKLKRNAARDQHEEDSD